MELLTTLIAPLPAFNRPGMRVVSALVPRTIVLLVDTFVPTPMAVELLTWVEAFRFPALAPMKVLLLPVVLLKPALIPKKALKLLVVLLKPALTPKKELELPVVF